MRQYYYLVSLVSFFVTYSIVRLAAVNCGVEYHIGSSLRYLLGQHSIAPYSFVGLILPGAIAQSLVLLFPVVLTARLLINVHSRSAAFSLAEGMGVISLAGALLGLTGIGATTSARSGWTASCVAIVLLGASAITIYLSPHPLRDQEKK